MKKTGIIPVLLAVLLILTACPHDKDPGTIAVTGISLDKTSAKLFKDDTETLIPAITPSDATNQSVTWSSSDENIATVEDGVVTAKDAGSATITVTTDDGGKTASCKVTVSLREVEVAVTGVSLKESTSLAVGGSETLIPAIEPDNATIKNVTWSSSDENIATVSEGGVVIAKNIGTATITITTIDGGKTAACNVTVNPKDIVYTVVEIPPQTYIRSPIEPLIVVKDGSTPLILDTDYTAVYTNNINAGEGTVTITGKGNYTGSYDYPFTINPKAITFSIDPIPSQAVLPDGAQINPAIVVVRDGLTPLILNTDYTVAFTINTSSGTATVTGKGNYEGSSGNGTFDIKAEAGAAVDAPTLKTVTENSITINAVVIEPSNGQTVEYAKNTTNTAPSSGWQSSTTFDGLDSVAAYYIFARSQGNATYSTGPSSISLMVITKLEVVSVPAGSFDMGKELKTDGGDNVTPVHTVTLSGFNMSKYQITQDQYETITGSNPGLFKSNPSGDEKQGRRPVENVSWYDAIVFCNKLSIAENLTPAYSISGETDPLLWGRVPDSNDSTWNAAEIESGSTGYRLPTEAQWEYAAKGGNGTPGNYTYSGSNTIGDVAWYSGNSIINNTNVEPNFRGTHEVGKKKPNGLGIYDMSGNVLEWCWDRYGSYSDEAQTDPGGADTGDNRVVRGGSYNSIDSTARSVYRNPQQGNGPFNRYNNTGLRVVRP